MLNAPLIALDGLVTASDRSFYRALGQRLAEARMRIPGDAGH